MLQRGSFHKEVTNFPEISKITDTHFADKMLPKTKGLVYKMGAVGDFQTLNVKHIFQRPFKGCQMV